jgi:hypothetical protein
VLKRTRISACAIGFALAQVGAQSTAIEPDRTQLAQSFIYALEVKSETVDSSSLGLVAGFIGESYRKSHEKFLAALKAAANDGEGARSLFQPLACAGVAQPGNTCRTLVEARDGLADDKLKVLLRREPTRSAPIANITIIFDGRFFQTPTNLYEARLTENDDVVISRAISVTYITTYSRKLHQEDIAANRHDSPFDGKLGSKEARMHYWLGGTNPRLLAELQRSVALTADLWSATLASGAQGVLAGDDSARRSLPLLKDLDGNDTTKCKTLHGSMLVAKDLGDYVWLVFTKNVEKAPNQFFIEPRCGFDY